MNLEEVSKYVLAQFQTSIKRNIRPSDFRLLLITLMIVVAHPIPGRANSRSCDSAEAIRMKFESQLFSLKPSVQRHFGTRMYRLTGDDKYLYPIIFDLILIEDHVASDAKNLASHKYIDERNKTLLDDFNPRTRKGGIRRELFSKDKYKSFLFKLDLLYRCNLLREFGLEKGRISEQFDDGIEYLKNASIPESLLDSEVVRDYGAQAANAVYQLYDLSISDIRREFKERIQNVFPDDQDDKLSEGEFEDKIYTLTHVIVAASGYYQHKVDKKDFRWILGYLETNLDRILSDTKPDVIAEVGISFLLAGKTDSGAVDACRASILGSIDNNKSMVLSQHGSSDLEMGEHRNILAYMLLCWSKSLHSGPNISKTNQYRDLVKSLGGNQ